MNEPRVVTRLCGGNPNHHLWNNNGTWFVCFTLHLPDYTKRRVRQSLKTKSISQARQRRDALFRKLRIRGPQTHEPKPLALAA